MIRIRQVLCTIFLSSRERGALLFSYTFESFSLCHLAAGMRPVPARLLVEWALPRPRLAHAAHSLGHVLRLLDPGALAVAIQREAHLG